MKNGFKHFEHLLFSLIPPYPLNSYFSFYNILKLINNLNLVSFAIYEFYFDNKYHINRIFVVLNHI